MAPISPNSSNKSRNRRPNPTTIPVNYSPKLLPTSLSNTHSMADYNSNNSTILTLITRAMPTIQTTTMVQVERHTQDSPSHKQVSTTSSSTP